MIPSCIFCITDKAHLISYNELAYCRFDDYPVTPGHVLIIPFRHVPSFFSLTEEEILAIGSLLQDAKKYLDKKFHPQGYNIGINDGIVAGQTIMHMHVHLIPRYPGDLDDPKAWVHKTLGISPDMIQKKGHPPIKDG